MSPMGMQRWRRHPVSRDRTGHMAIAGEGSSGYRRFFSYLLRQHKSIKKKKNPNKTQTQIRKEKKNPIQHLQQINL